MLPIRHAAAKVVLGVNQHLGTLLEAFLNIPPFLTHVPVITILRGWGHAPADQSIIYCHMMEHILPLTHMPSLDIVFLKLTLRRSNFADPILRPTHKHRKTVLPEVGSDGDGSDEETATISLTSGAVVSNTQINACPSHHEEKDWGGQHYVIVSPILPNIFSHDPHERLCNVMTSRLIHAGSLGRGGCPDGQRGSAFCWPAISHANVQRVG